MLNVFIIDFFIFSLLLLSASLLRANIGIIQKTLAPICIIAGIIGFFLVNTGLLPFFSGHLSDYLYHLTVTLFGLTGLTTGAGLTASGEGKKEKIWTRGVKPQIVLWIFISGVGALIVALISLLLFPKHIFHCLLSTFGFILGPGQAYSLGLSVKELSFHLAPQAGIFYGTIGYSLAAFVGVALVRIGISRGYSNIVSSMEEVPPHLFKGMTSDSNWHESAGKTTTSLEAIETLTFIVAMLGLTYLSAFLFAQFLENIILSMGETLSRIAGIIEGTIWMFGLVFGVIWGYVLGKADLGYLINPGLTKRLIGVNVDFMVVISFCALSVPLLSAILSELILFAVIAFSVVFLTTWYVMPRVLPDYHFERMVGFFGTATGQISAGAALLRVLDHRFETVVYPELALGMAPCIIPFVPSILLGSLAQLGVHTNEYILVVPFLLYAIFIIALSIFLLSRYWGSVPSRFKGEKEE